MLPEAEGSRRLSSLNNPSPHLKPSEYQNPLMVKSLVASELPIDQEITGHLGSVGVRLRSISLRSCTVEHQKQVRVSSDMKLLVRWEGITHTIPVRVLRSRIGMMMKGGTGYHTTVELVQLPEAVTALISRFMECGAGTTTEPGQGSGPGIHA